MHFVSHSFSTKSIRLTAYFILSNAQFIQSFAPIQSESVASSQTVSYLSPHTVKFVQYTIYFVLLSIQHLTQQN